MKKVFITLIISLIAYFASAQKITFPEIEKQMLEISNIIDTTTPDNIKDIDKLVKLCPTKPVTEKLDVVQVGLRPRTGLPSFTIIPVRIKVYRDNIGYTICSPYSTIRIRTKY